MSKEDLNLTVEELAGLALTCWLDDESIWKTMDGWAKNEQEIDEATLIAIKEFADPYFRQFSIPRRSGYV